VRFVVLAVVALVLCLIQHAVFARYAFCPDLVVALLAWAVVDGVEHGVVARAWLIGAIRDLTDPLAELPGRVSCFWSVAFLLLALAFLPVRGLVFRSRGAAWAAWALLAYPVLAIADHLLFAGMAVWEPWPMAISALLTAIATLPIGGVLGRLPGRWHPVGLAGA